MDDVDGDGAATTTPNLRLDIALIACCATTGKACARVSLILDRRHGAAVAACAHGNG
jgi:hypothetical protein